MFNNPFAFSPLGEKRTPQQDRLFDLFFGSDKKHAVIHGPECGASLGGLALAIENIIKKGRDIIYVVPTCFKPIQLVREEYGSKVNCTSNSIISNETGARIRIYPYNAFTAPMLAGIEPESADLLIDGTFAFHDSPQALIEAIESVAPERMMTFDRAGIRKYATGLEHPATRVIERFNCKVVNLACADSTLLKPEKLDFYRRFAAQQGYDVEKYMNGEMF